MNKTVKVFTITKGNFLDWLFQGDEGEKIKIYLADAVIDKLYDYDAFMITIEDLFKDTDFDSLDVTLTEENEDEFDDRVLGELGIEFKVKLKN